MKPFGLLVGCLMITCYTQAQLVMAASQSQFSYSSETEYLRGKPDVLFTGIKADPQLNYNYASPWLSNWAISPGGQPYWLSGTTTQSFNHGKFGTIYYYDQMGNMRYASPFIDIAGKNKRGLKLLLPTFTQRMFTGR